MGPMKCCEYGPVALKPLTSVINCLSHFRPSPIFAGKAGAHPSRATYI